MKILLAIIITATFSFGCAMLEGEQTTTDTGGGGTATPTRNNAVQPTVYFDCNDGVDPDNRSMFSDYAVWNRNLSNCDEHQLSSGRATDSSGNIYIFGNINIGLEGVWRLSQLSSDGTKQWSQDVWTDSSHYPNGPPLHVDSSNNVYVFSVRNINNTYSSGSTVYEHTVSLKKYNSAGAEQWSKDFSIKTNNMDRREWLNIDESGNVIVSIRGNYQQEDGGYEHKLVLHQYNSAGVEQWNKEYVAQTYHAEPIFFDKKGNFYLKTSEEYCLDNSSYPSCGSSAQMSKTTIKKYNVAGTEQWSQVLSDERAPFSAHYQPVIDDIGNVYSFAKKDVVDDYGNWTTQNVIVKYSSVGAELWSQNLTNFNGYNEQIRVDDIGNVYITHPKNILDGNGNWATQTVLVKYSSAGAELWSQILPDPDNFDISSWTGTQQQLNFDNNGNVYVTNSKNYWSENSTQPFSSVHTKVDSSGSIQWSKKQKSEDLFQNLPSFGYSSYTYLTTDNNGNAYLAADIRHHGHCNCQHATHVTKLNNSGEEQWSHKYSEMSYGGLFKDGITGDVYLEEQQGYLDSMGHWIPQNTYLLKLR